MREYARNIPVKKKKGVFSGLHLMAAAAEEEEEEAEEEVINPGKTGWNRVIDGIK